MKKIETWSGNGELRQIKEKILSRVEVLRLGGSKGEFCEHPETVCTFLFKCRLDMSFIRFSIGQ